MATYLTDSLVTRGGKLAVAADKLRVDYDALVADLVRDIPAGPQRDDIVTREIKNLTLAVSAARLNAALKLTGARRIAAEKVSIRASKIVVTDGEGIISEHTRAHEQSGAAVSQIYSFRTQVAAARKRVAPKAVQEAVTAPTTAATHKAAPKTAKTPQKPQAGATSRETVALAVRAVVQGHQHLTLEMVDALQDIVDAYHAAQEEHVF